MLAKQIKSLQHPIIKELVLLRKKASFRKEKKKIVIFGYKIISEIAKKTSLSLLLTTDDTRQISYKAKQHIVTTNEAIKKISGQKNPQPIAAVVERPKEKELWQKKFLLVLDNIQDPGNLGTLIRTAYALGWEGVILTSPGADIFNDKVINASKGICLYMPYCYSNEEKIINKIRSHHINAYVADMKGQDFAQLSFLSPLFLVLSNEAKGTKAWAHDHCQPVSIPIKKIDSLNVAVAGGILLQALKKEGK